MNLNDATIVGYIDHAGELKHYKFSFDNLPIGSEARCARVSELERQMEALQGQGIRCGRWTLHDWAAGWGRATLLKPKANFAKGTG